MWLVLFRKEEVARESSWRPAWAVQQDLVKNRRELKHEASL